MRILIIKFAKGKDKGPRGYLALEDRLKENAHLEMRGLGIAKSQVKPTTSNWCTLWLLKNGVTVCKYGYRYAIIAQSKRAVYETTDLLKLQLDELTITIADQQIRAD